MVPEPASGAQYRLRAGDYAADVASVGASLRTLTFRGRHLTVPFDADEVRPAYRGATLAPWPNRVVGGRYRFGGVDQELPLTEPRRGHALHGLTVWHDYRAVEQSDDAVTLETTIVPQAGYPHRVIVRSRYVLTDHGLCQTVTARNEGAKPAPWGCAPHPYLVAGIGPMDDWSLTLPASKVLHATADRLVPTVLKTVDDNDDDAARFDFRIPRLIGQVEIDHAYTALSRDESGMAVVTLAAADGSGVAMTWGRSCAWVQIHTADMPGGSALPGHRAGLAVEPMTCAPDAFNGPRYPFDAGVIALGPGESASAEWRIYVL